MNANPVAQFVCRNWFWYSEGLSGYDVRTPSLSPAPHPTTEANCLMHYPVQTPQKGTDYGLQATAHLQELFSSSCLSYLTICQEHLVCWKDQPAGFSFQKHIKLPQGWVLLRAQWNRGYIWVSVCLWDCKSTRRALLDLTTSPSGPASCITWWPNSCPGGITSRAWRPRPSFPWCFFLALVLRGLLPVDMEVLFSHHTD